MQAPMIPSSPHVPITAIGSVARDRVIRKFVEYWPVVEAVAQMSKDPSTKVGAIALDDKLNIVATGRNGFPRGVEDTPERYADRDTKYRLVSHAEQNLIAQAAYSGRSLAGTTLLVSSLYPCANCAKSIIQAGVVRVISPRFDGNERWIEESRWARLMFTEAGVECLYIEDLMRNLAVAEKNDRQKSFRFDDLVRGDAAVLA